MKSKSKSELIPEPYSCVVQRDADGRFAKGNTLAPQAGSGAYQCGRLRALAALDRVCGDEKNIELMTAAIQADLRKDPLAFFFNRIVPLLPKSYNIEQTITSITGHDILQELRTSKIVVQDAEE